MTFAESLSNELKVARIRASELSRRAKVRQATTSDIIRGLCKPTPRVAASLIACFPRPTAKRLARAFFTDLHAELFALAQEPGQ